MTQITLHDAATVLLAAINRKEEEVTGYQMIPAESDHE
jgi:hypothetical protein